MELQKKLVYLRKEKGLSQIELAEALHVSRQAISRWEVGTATPTMRNLSALSKLYGISLNTLLGDKHEADAYRDPVKTEEKEEAAGRPPILRKVRKASIMVILAALMAAVVCSILGWRIGLSNDQEERTAIINIEQANVENDPEWDEMALSEGGGQE